MTETHLYSQAFVAVVAVIERDGRFLMLKEHMPGQPDHDKWNFPAGWVDLHERPLQAVLREAWEEVGVEFEPRALLGVYSIVRHDIGEALGMAPHAVRLVYKGTTADPGSAEDSLEASEVAWFTADEIRAMDRQTIRDVDIPFFLDDFERGVEYPLEMVRHTVVFQEEVVRDPHDRA